MNSTTGRAPYRGLAPYGEEDAGFFFGRRADAEIIGANLAAARLTLLYGSSGVGKSSVLRAGVAHNLRERARADLAARRVPDSVVVVYDNWSEDPVEGLAARVREAALDLYGARAPEDLWPDAMPPASRSLVEILCWWSERMGAELLIILDQFEEYFLYHEADAREGSFDVELPRALNDPVLRANFLISIREDALARLDRFKARIPQLFANRLHIEHLDRAAAREAILRPIEEYNRLVGDAGESYRVEPALVDAVLDDPRMGQATSEAAGRGTARSEARPDRIETTFLQLVMTRLWDAEVQAGSHTLRRSTLVEQLAGVGNIIRTHLDAAMSTLPPEEQDLAERLFQYLVTPTGSKIALSAVDLAAYVQSTPEQVAPVLEKLSGRELRVLRPVGGEPGPGRESGGADATRYEIRHDALGPTILDWRVRHARAREQAQAARDLASARARARRLGVGLAVVGLLLLAAIGVILYNAWVPAEMSGRGLNIAIAEFGELGPDGSLRHSADGRSLSREVYDAFRADLGQFPGLASSVTVWHDSLPWTKKRATIGIIRDPPDAARAAERLRADLLVYGYIKRGADGTVSIYQQYYSRLVVPGGTEILGPYGLGSPIRSEGRNPALLAGGILKTRVTALLLIAQGAAYERQGDLERALEAYQGALDAKNWQGLQGAELLYSLIGQDLLRLGRQEEAWAAFGRALDVNPDFGPAYLGQGDVFYRRARELQPEQRAETQSALEGAARSYKSALDVPDQARDPHVASAAQLGLANSDYLRADAAFRGGDAARAGDLYRQAIKEFDVLVGAGSPTPTEERDHTAAQAYLGRGASRHHLAYLALAGKDPGLAGDLLSQAADDYSQAMEAGRRTRNDLFAATLVTNYAEPYLNLARYTRENLRSPRNLCMTTKASLRLRAGPDHRAAIVDTLVSDAVVIPTGAASAGPWVEVVARDRRGWVLASLLDCQGPDAMQAAAQAPELPLP